MGEVEAAFVRRTAEARELVKTQRAEAAETALRALLAERDDHEVHTLLAYALLMQGRYPEGFAEFEHREMRRTTPARQLSYPEWDGAALDGRSILVFTEQGLGDEVMLARFIPDLRQRGASRIVVACQPAAVPIFAQTGADEVVPRFQAGGGQVRIPRCDTWVLLFSLPHRLGLQQGDVRGAPYLRTRGAGGGGIGIVELGRPANPVDSNRSIHDGALRRAFPQAMLLEPRGDAGVSLEQVAALDLLITVDTAWAHMAGAIGTPCWVLLPHRGLDWRWRRGEPRSHWYDSLRLFRQDASCDWAPVIADVRRALEAREA